MLKFPILQVIPSAKGFPSRLVTALQLIEYPYGDGIEVIFAGGRRGLIPNTETDPEYATLNGERLDGRDLIQEWVDKHPNSQYVWNKAGFDQIDVDNVDHVIGTLRLKWLSVASVVVH